MGDRFEIRARTASGELIAEIEAQSYEDAAAQYARGGPFQFAERVTGTQGKSGCFRCGSRARNGDTLHTQFHVRRLS